MPRTQLYEENRTTVSTPDTLDLAERAAIAINGLTGVLDPAYDHEIFFWVKFKSRPPYMHHDSVALPTTNCKFAESLAMMRVMSGSTLNLDFDKGLMRALLDGIGDDGLYYSRRVVAGKERTWHEGVTHVYPVTGEDFANVYGNARLILAMLAYYQLDGDSAWEGRIAKMVKRLAEIAICKDDYAYYPDSQVGEAFSYPRSGWRRTDEPQSDDEGAEHSVIAYQGAQIRAFSRWYLLSGDKQALEMARRLTNFILKPRFWGTEAERAALSGPAARTELGPVNGVERGHFSGHFHGRLIGLRGLLEYALVTGDERLMEFVRDSYEFSRSFGIGAIGCFTHCTEACAIADMVALAVKLSDAGIGDYWEDVEQYIRNQLVEHQLLRADLLEQVSRAGSEREIRPPQETADRVIERSIGAFGAISDPTCMPDTYSIQCCTANATQALYYAWESIVRHEAGLAQINLLLNRSSAWLDIASYLPYKGKVIITNKSSGRIAVRIPRWVDSSTLRWTVNGRNRPAAWLGRYLLVEGLKANDVVTIEFSLPERTNTYTFYGQEYSCYFRGNTLVDISPRLVPAGSYPIYLRDHYKQSVAPEKHTPRYVAPKLIEW